MIESAWVILGNHDIHDRSPRPLLEWVRRTVRS